MGRFKKIILLVMAMMFCAEQPYVFSASAWADEPTAYRLSLDEITRLALRNNFDIQIAKHEAWIARTDNEVAVSIYDTIFNGEVGYRKDKSKKTSIIFGSKTVDNDYNIGLSQKLPTGTDISVGLSNNRQFTDSSFTTSPLTHESTLELVIEQDLGKNFLGIQDRGDIKVTRLDVANKEYTSLDKIENQLAQVQEAYWDLVLAIERVRIEEDMVEQAKRLYDIHMDKLEVGLVEMPEAVAAEVNYEKRKNELKLARNAVTARENVLKLLINRTSENVSIIPSQDLSLPDAMEFLQTSMKKAFDNRRDYLTANNIIKQRNIELSMSKNNLWPEINLTASLARNGLGDHFDDSVTNTTNENNPNFFAGLSVSMPLLNTEARAELEAAELRKAKDIIGMKLIEKTIAIDIMDRVRNCNVFREVAMNNIRIANMEKQKLSAEEKRFNAGRSDTDTLIRFQEDLIQARLLAAEAKHRYQIAVIDLRLNEATLLNTYWDGAL